MKDVKSMIKDVAVLLVITAASGLILGLVYQITKEPITLAREKAANEAYAEVFQEAAAFEKAEAPAELYPSVEIAGVLEAKDSSGALLGYVLTVISHEGYGGDITFTMGIQKDGTLNGISILGISETPGLGMRAEEVLKPQFVNKNTEEFSYTKTGAVTDSQIDAISGATVTTNAVTNAVNGGLYYFRTQLGGDAE